MLLLKNPVALLSESYAVLYPEVSQALREMHIPYKLLKAKEIEEGKLKLFSALIIPGGYTFKLLSSLTEKTANEIRSFIIEGGGYIGICMGAYAASALKLCEAEALRRYGEGVVNIAISNPKHPIAEGFQEKIEMFYQNGPEIISKHNEEVIGKFQSGKAAILATNLEDGKIVLFSPHPEKLKTTWKMLKNAVEFCVET
ncbi:hypothetical protein KEJ50_06555 [Candidatus Bathyarchaeota archaeon]|nr:hypothetical protein [Candidatus Bathyarchaeota archaeon]